jgi:hypothetical protein
MDQSICVNFIDEPARDLQNIEIIQGVVFKDLGNDYANPPLNSAYPKIYDVDGDGKNEFWISQGTVQLMPLSSGPFQVSGLAAHWFGGVGQLTITGHDLHNKIVSVANNTVAKQGVYENIVLFDKDIWYINIRGVELAFDKVCFFKLNG